jgi:hypothetical protein
MNVKHGPMTKKDDVKLAPLQGLARAVYSLTHGAEPYLRSFQLCSYSRTSQHFMQPGGSSPHSHKPSTGPYRAGYTGVIRKYNTKS